MKYDQKKKNQQRFLGGDCTKTQDLGEEGTGIV